MPLRKRETMDNDSITLVKWFGYRVRSFNTTNAAKFPREHVVAQMFHQAVQRRLMDNQSIGIFSLGKDAWGHESLVAVWFHDFNVWIADAGAVINEPVA
jgi:hypothetical protein